MHHWQIEEGRAIITREQIVLLFCTKPKQVLGDGTQIMHAIGGERFGAYSSQHFVYSLLGVILSTPLHTEEDV